MFATERSMAFCCHTTSVCLQLRAESVTESVDGVECVLDKASIEALGNQDILDDWPTSFRSAPMPNLSFVVHKPRIAPKAKPKLKFGLMATKLKRLLHISLTAPLFS